MDDKKDIGLQGNEEIEKAILALQEEPSQEFLAHTLTVIRRRMKAGGQLVIAVEPSVGDSQIRIETLDMENGEKWWMAFTGFEEELKGGQSVKSTFLTDMDKLFSMAVSVDEIEGVIMNPWNRTIMLNKRLLNIILGNI